MNKIEEKVEFFLDFYCKRFQNYHQPNPPNLGLFSQILIDFLSQFYSIYFYKYFII